MSVRRFLFTLLMALLSVSCLGASVCTRPSAGLWAGGAFCIPTADYLKQYPGDEDAAMPPVRTSLSFGADAAVLDLSVSRFSFGAGFSFAFTCRSVAYGQSVLREYYGLGPLLNLGYDITDSFSMCLKFRYLRCFFSGSRSSFICAEAEAVPMFRIFSAKSADGFLCTPVTVSYKSDTVT
ncbi:MAG: hypothetical protein IKR80_01085, partial [Spirochaetales bacterium]|nr:hypothetical protein [Spirochaetales bacterium]